MNHNLYRIVFNVRRGQLMVVAESARAQGKSTAERGGMGVGEPGGSHLAALRRPLAAILALCGLQGLLVSHACAQIVAYRNAPGNQQATVLTTGNGTPQVNIQTPSEAGVSHNTYSQFDVDGRGVVLNNSRKGATSQIGGQVAGNPWLAKGTAKVILNEVVSSNPSKLNGVVEVAGDRAEVVIANPAGVAIDGGGFINASRVTVSTGKANLKNGAIDSHDVKQGTITIDGKGLDASQADYAALLARAVRINGALHAKELRIVTGANRVSADHKTVTRIEGNGAAPEYALDVSQLGGMYAGKIVMVGTEAGVGVRNAGKISAGAGEFTLTVDGKLVNTGQIVADGNADIEALGGVANKGSAYAKGNIKIVTERTVDNTGLIGAQGDATLMARGEQGDIVSLAGSSLIAGLTPEGLFIDSGTLTLDAGRKAQANGTNRAGSEIKVSGQFIGVWGSNTSAPLIRFEVIPNSTRRSRARRENGARTANEADTSGTLDASAASIYADDLLVMWTDGLLRTDNANIQADRIQIGAYDISNRGGRLVQSGTNALTIDVPGLIDNTGGSIQDGGDLTLRAGSLNNDGGRIGSGGKLAVDVAGHLANGSGTLAGTRGTTVVAGSLESSGLIDGAVTTRDHLDNSGAINGTATAGTSLSNAGVIVGDASAGGSLGNAGSIGGSASAGTTFDNAGTVAGNVKAGGDLANTGEIGGDAEAGGNLSNTKLILGAANARHDVSNSGKVGADVAAGGRLDSSGTIYGSATAKGNLDNSGDIAKEARADGKLTSSGLIVGNVKAGGDLANSGEIGGDVEAGGNLSNTKLIVGGVSAAHDVANSGKVGKDVAAGGRLSSSGTIYGSATAKGDLDNSGDIVKEARADGKLTSSGVIVGNATAKGSLANSGDIGGAASAGGSLSNDGLIVGNASAGTALDNTGRIGGSASAGASLSNSGGIGGSATAVGSLGNSGSIGGSADAGTFLGNSGSIGGGAQAGTGLDNAGSIGGNVRTGGHLGNSGDIGGSVTASDLGNTGSVGGGAHITGHIDNAGTLGANGNAIIDAASIKNSGTIGSTQGATAINTQSLDNSHGTLQGGEGLFVVSQGKLDNTGGTIQSGGALAVLDGSKGGKSLDIVNTGGSITGGTAVVIDTATLGRDGSIVSHGAFSASLNGDYTQGVDAPFFEASGPVSLQFSGTVSNDTVWHNDAGLSVTGGTVINTGEISSNGITQVHATEGSLTNSGLIQGEHIAISGVDLDNGGGRILGDTLQARFTGNANNAGGSIDISGASDIRIDGKLDNTGGRLDTGSLSLDVGGDLINRSEAGGPRAGITARNGDLDLNVGGNLQMQGADLNASGDLHGFVLGDILVDAPAKTGSPVNLGLQQRATSDITKVSLGSTAPEAGSTNAPPSDLHAGGDLSLIAGGNARYQGIDIQAGGDLTLGAVTGDLDLTPRIDSQTVHTEDTQDFSIGDTQGDQLTTLTDTHSETARGGKIGAGGAITLLAGHDLDLAGSDLQAGGDLTARAGHNLNAGAIATVQDERIQKYNPNARTDEAGVVQDISADTTQTTTITHHGGHLNANGDITLDAGHGNPFNAGMVRDIETARGEAGLAAPLARLNEAPGSLTLTGAKLSAGSDTARQDITLLAAGDISINGQSDTTTQRHDPGQVSGLGLLRTVQGLSGQLSGPIVTTDTANPSGQLTGNNITVRSDQGKLTLGNLDLDASQDLTLHSGAATRIDGTTLTAGRDLRLTSIGDLTSTGSDFTAGNALSLISQGHIAISGSTEHQEWGGKNDHHIRDTATASHLSGKTITLAAIGERTTDAEGKTTGSNLHLDHVELASTGKTTLTATGDITLDPGQNYSYDYKHESHSSGFIAEKTTTRTHESETRTVLASTVKAGSLDIAALGNLKITATEFDLKGDSRIQAAGKIDYLAAHNETRTLDESTTSRSLVGQEYKSSTQHSSSQGKTALVTSVQSEADVLSISDGDTTMQGTRIETTGKVHIQAGGNLKLDAVESSEDQLQYTATSDRIKEGGFTPTIHAKERDQLATHDTTLTGVSIHGEKIALVAVAGNLTGTAADLVAKNGIGLGAGGHVLLEAGQEIHSRQYQRSSSEIGHTTIKTDDRVHFVGVNRTEQRGESTDYAVISVGSHLDAGAGKLATHSTGNTLIVGSKLDAKSGIDLYAGGRLSLGGSLERNAHHDEQQETTLLFRARDGASQDDVVGTNRATEITSEGGITLHGKEKVVLGNVEFHGKTTFDTPEVMHVIERSFESHDQKLWDKDWSYANNEGHGRYDETPLYAKFDSPSSGITKDTKVSFELDTHGVQSQPYPVPGTSSQDGSPPLTNAQYQSLVQELATQPGMGYLKELANRTDIDWQAAATQHEQWDYKASGLTPAGGVVVVAVVSYLTWGTCSEAAAGLVVSTGTSVGAGTVGAAVAAGIAAGMVTGAGQLAVSTINNHGHLDKVAKDVTSEESLKQVLAAMVTAGVLNAPIVEGAQAGTMQSINDLARSGGASGLVGMAGRSVVNAGVSSAITGADFEDSLRNNLVNEAAAVGANAIGTEWGSGDNKNPFLQTAAHGVLGCAAAAMKGGDCKSGAVGGMTESILGNVIDEFGGLSTTGNGYSRLTQMLYTTGATLAADIVAEHFGLDSGDARAAAQNAATNNRLAHGWEKDRYKQLAKETGISAERLEAAGCTKIDCKAEFAPGSKEYQNAQRQAERGAEDEEALKVINQEKEKNGEFLNYKWTEQYVVDPLTRTKNQTVEGLGTAKDVVTYKAVDEAVLQPMANDERQVKKAVDSDPVLGPIYGSGRAIVAAVPEVVGTLADAVYHGTSISDAVEAYTGQEAGCFSSLCDSFKTKGAAQTFSNLGTGIANLGPKMYDDFSNGRFEQGTESLMNVALIVDGGVALTKLGVGVVRDWKALQAEKVAFEHTVSEGEVANNFYRDGSEYTFTSSNEINALHEAKGGLAPYMPDTPVIQGFAPKGITETQVISEAQVKLVEGNEGGLGQWSTTDAVPNQGYARNNLAIIPDFKADVGYTVTIETVQETPFNRGVVGPQEGAAGGGMQTEWLVPKSERGDYIVPLQETIKPLSPGTKMESAVIEEVSPNVASDLPILNLQHGDEIVSNSVQALAVTRGDKVIELNDISLLKKNDTLTIVAHGSTEKLGGMNASELADLLKSNGLDAKHIELVACRTGGACFAQELANQTGATVTAPISNINVIEGIYGIPQVRDPLTGALRNPGELVVTVKPLQNQGFIDQFIANLLGKP